VFSGSVTGITLFTCSCFHVIPTGQAQWPEIYAALNQFVGQPKVNPARILS